MVALIIVSLMDHGMAGLYIYISMQYIHIVLVCKVVIYFWEQICSDTPEKCHLKAHSDIRFSRVLFQEKKKKQEKDAQRLQFYEHQEAASTTASRTATQEDWLRLYCLHLIILMRTEMMNTVPQHHKIHQTHK